MWKFRFQIGYRAFRNTYHKTQIVGKINKKGICPLRRIEPLEGKKMLRQYTVLIRREKEGYLAHCLETEMLARGATQEEARENLRRAIEVYLRSNPPEEYPKEGVDLCLTRIEVSV
jgi:predicted RNase H-like HicB family nuclease